MEEDICRVIFKFFRQAVNQDFSRRGSLCILDATEDQNLDFSSHSSTEILILSHNSTKSLL